MIRIPSNEKLLCRSVECEGFAIIILIRSYVRTKVYLRAFPKSPQTQRCIRSIPMYVNLTGSLVFSRFTLHSSVYDRQFRRNVDCVRCFRRRGEGRRGYENDDGGLILLFVHVVVGIRPRIDIRIIASDAVASVRLSSTRPRGDEIETNVT